MPHHDTSDDHPGGIGTGYAAFQLAKALTTQEIHPDPQVRARAAERTARWRKVMMHALTGTAEYGSRTPLAGIPAWVTLEVATGGFATGELLAGGPLSDHERQLTATLPGIRPGYERLDLNTYYLSDAGIAELQNRLEQSDYRIDVPEEAALPTIAWLLEQQREEDAWALLEVIAPFFDRLRFHPPARKAHGHAAAEEGLYVVSAGQVAERLATLPPQPRIAAQKQAVDVRLPLYDAAIALFLQTCRNGWPCRHYPAGWQERAATLCTRISTTTIPRDPRKHRDAELFALLAQCAANPRALTGRQVGRIRRIVDDFVHRHGHPDSESHRQHRAMQRRDVAAPSYHLFARIAALRLNDYPPDTGIADFTQLSAPLSAEEAEKYALPAGSILPWPIRRRLECCQSGTMAKLVARVLVTSGEAIARLLPMLTAKIHSAQFNSATARGLYAATYRAFRRRRSLLLVDLQHQVTLNDLSWVAALENDRKCDTALADLARQTLAETAALTITAFPQAILPNKLLQEFRALARTAKLDLPFTDELAADIFMNAFSGKFAQAARRAASLLGDALYARYYAIDTDTLAQLPEEPRAETFALLCTQRADVRPRRRCRSPAVNGTIIEQQQILTTQNLALLFDDLGLRDRLHAQLPAMALKSFAWSCAYQQTKSSTHHARLVMLKRAAYAWRQMIFYLSLIEASARETTLGDIRTHFDAQSPAFKKRFQPVMLGLDHAAAGHILPQHGAAPNGGRVFLGWSATPHWLMPPETSLQP